MTVKIRMTRKGNRHNPFYRIVVADERTPRDGRFIEIVGTYDPTKDPAAVKLELERVDYWVGHGAKPTQTVSEIINRYRKGQAK
ncbi:MAG: 30S ribosomal protein S16 [Proteobacteria bacterium]|jgi:small subunit ribosomal protein S16|nr:30S ribosomal protein S16 [Pseudomonadota bacterium]NLN62380.1 30S ribosomal protein S16 [Myxococcales bacterium]